MRILIFHGYLLDGTGSNVYNARLAQALLRLGHDVHLFCQDLHPERQTFVGSSGDWDSGELKLSLLGGPLAVDSPHCTVYRPDIGGLLPLYVYDRYEGVEAKTFAECTEAEIATYIRTNVDAVREVVERVQPDVGLANHLVMGPVILARALVGNTPYAVKIHGSALEYTVKPEPERFMGFAREGLDAATTVLVGSMHTARSLWAAFEEDRGLKARTRLGPPGVDVDRFRPRNPQQARVDMQGLLERLRNEPAVSRGVDSSSAFARDDAAVAEAIERLLEGSGQIVAFVGKLIPAKGIDLLIAAWPLVLERQPHARLLVIGFGSWRAEVEGLCQALAEGDLEAVESNALPHHSAFLRGLGECERERYASSARALGEHVLFSGRLDHEELASVLPACEALVVPSTFPEAFGMVAAEAAACGVLPVSAAHSGLAEVSEVLAAELPSQASGWLSFPLGGGSVRAISECVCGWLEADRELKRQTRAALVSVVRERWSWEGVALGVIAAARGEPAARPFG
jgi:glycosyltransferase involved in cell wall biosynthesis